MWPLVRLWAAAKCTEQSHHCPRNYIKSILWSNTSGIPETRQHQVFYRFNKNIFFTSSCPNRRGDDYLCVWTCSSSETYSIYCPAAFLHCGHNQFFSPTTNFQFVFFNRLSFFTHKSSDIFCCQRVQQVQSLYVCQCVYRVDFILIIKQLIIKSVIIISSWPAC